MAVIARFTWDGLPIAPDQPHGAAIVVRQASVVDGQPDYLVLHRAHHGPGYEGDWAWTPPSGSRQPGEPVLAAALRELEEETGLQAAASDLRVLDLGGRWAVFGLDVPAGTGVRIDAEHDKFEWLPANAAIARCRPPAVADGVRLAEKAVAAHLSFRPLGSADLPALISWQHAPHAVRWFPERLDLAAAERKYAPRIAGQSPVRVHVVSVDGRDCGFIQHYRAESAADSYRVGVDFAIGAADLVGRGLGPQLIWSYLRDVALPAHPEARLAVADPDPDNHRSIRALQKAGFVEARTRGDGARCVLDVSTYLGRPIAGAAGTSAATS